MERIRQLRNEKGLSQAKLAVRADMDPATLNRLEQGKGNPNLKTLERVAEALGVEVADLLGKAPRRSSPEPSLLSELEDERRRTFVQSCRRYAQTRAEHYELERRLAEAQEGGVYAGPEGARSLFLAAFEEYDELRALFGRDLAFLLVEGLSDYEASRFSGLAVLTLRPLAETVERIADRAAELAETEAQKAEVERRREEMRRSA